MDTVNAISNDFSNVQSSALESNKAENAKSEEISHLSKPKSDSGASSQCDKIEISSQYLDETNKAGSAQSSAQNAAASQQLTYTVVHTENSSKVENTSAVKNTESIKEPSIVSNKKVYSYQLHSYTDVELKKMLSSGTITQSEYNSEVVRRMLKDKE